MLAAAAHRRERLGSTYIKLGQIISSGEGIFPEELVSSSSCRDQVPAEPFDIVRAVVEQDLCGPSKPCSRRFDRVPLAAASIAQVHARDARARARTSSSRCSDRRSRSSSARTSPVMSWVAPQLVGRIPIAALANPPALVELFAETITEELDFRLEADNMLDVATRVRGARPAWLRDPAAPPDARHSPRARDGAAVGLRVRRRRRHEARGVDTHAVVRTGMIGFMEGAIDLRHLPRRPPRRATCSCSPTDAPRCSTSASPVG